MRSRIIGVLVPRPADGAPLSRAARDVLTALEAAGKRARAIPADRDLEGGLRREPVELAFLALEGRHGDDGAVLTLLEALGVPHTGPTRRAAALAGDRVRARDLLRRSGLPTPPGYTLPADLSADQARDLHRDLGYPVLVQPALRASPRRAARALDALALAAACDARTDDLLVERLVPGPRIRIALLDHRPVGAAIAPPALHDDPFARPRAHLRARPVGAARSPGVSSAGAAAVVGARRLEGMLRQAAAVARVLGLRGASLIDIALDPGGNELVLDVDPSPCLARGAAFAAIARRAGMRFEEVIAVIAAGVTPVDQPLAA